MDPLTKEYQTSSETITNIADKDPHGYAVLSEPWGCGQAASEHASHLALYDWGQSLWPLWGCISWQDLVGGGSWVGGGCGTTWGVWVTALDLDSQWETGLGMRRFHKFFLHVLVCGVYMYMHPWEVRYGSVCFRIGCCIFLSESNWLWEISKWACNRQPLRFLGVFYVQNWVKTNTLNTIVVTIVTACLPWLRMWCSVHLVNDKRHYFKQAIQ